MFKWNSTPNLISYLRPLLIGIATIIAAVNNTSYWWAFALWLNLAGWATDALDGWAAKRICGKNNYGERVDKICDGISLVFQLLIFCLYDFLPQHFYYTLWAMWLWVPRCYFMMYRPKHIAGGIIEILQMTYFSYLLFGLALLFSEKGYGYIPFAYRITIISIVGAILVIAKWERLIGIIKDKLNPQMTPA